MPQIKIHVHQKFSTFFNSLILSEFFNPTVLLHLSGYLFFFTTLSLLPQNSTTGILFLFIILIYFWSKSINHLYLRQPPPAELTIGLVILLSLLERGLLALLGPGTALPGSLPTALLLALIVLLFSGLLVQNCRRKSALIWYVLLGYLAVILLEGSNTHYWQILRVFLFLMLFRKTAWVEKLTRAENWLYLPIFLMLFWYLAPIFKFSPEAGGIFSQDPYFHVTHYIFTIIHLYLLAVTLKIPFVLVYHHARLARKLRIAGLFQSNAPQFIQLLMLLLFFYFFIAGWQADNLRNAIDQQLDDLRNGTDSTATQLTIHRWNADSSYTLPGGRQIRLTENLPEQGLMGMEDSTQSGEKKYFFFYRNPGEPDRSVTFLEVNSRFAGQISSGLPYLAASHLVMHPLTLSGWDSTLYYLNLWHQENTYSELRTFPFAIAPRLPRQSRFYPLNPDQTSTDVKMKLKIFGLNRLILGRVFMPVYDTRFNSAGQFAWDLILELNWSFVSSPLARQLLFWLVIYLLANLLIIRQVVRFGNQITQMIIQKFNQLKYGIHQISTGQLDYKIRLEGEDEFVELGERFNLMGDRLNETIEKLREKDRLESELKIARDVQLSFLPRQLPDIPGYQVAAHIQTATEVGGDFYDGLQLDEHRYLFAIGDVSGKSTSAAFYMAQFISLLRFATQTSDNPREILKQINRYFADPAVDTRIFVTVLLALLDTRQHTVRFFCAGHPRPFFLPGSADGTIKELKMQGLGIGLERTGNLFSKSLQGVSQKLQPADSLFFFTDGMPEAARPGITPEQPEFFGEERLTGLLKTADRSSAGALIQQLKDEIDSFYGQHPPIDDYTLLVIRRHSGQKPGGD